MRTGDDGYATVWTLVAMAIVVVVAGISVILGTVALDRHRAEAAADAAALAAALSTINGPTVACQRAGSAATANHARLTTCVVADATATVTAVVALPGPLAHFGPAKARARAGPAP